MKPDLVLTDPNEKKKLPISFFAPGLPRPQARPRAFARKFGNIWQARVYNASTAEGWKSCIAIAARPHLPVTPLQGPLRVDVDLYLPRPKAHYRSNGELKSNAPIWHTSRGDRDNFDKAILDCLTEIGMWKDDGQVCCGEVSKIYTPCNRVTGAKIRIECL